MSWDQRQRSMLEAMGLRVWARAEAEPGRDVELERPAPNAVPQPVRAEPEAAFAGAAPMVRMAPAVPIARAAPVAPSAPAGQTAATAVTAVQRQATRADNPAAAEIAAMDWAGLQAAVAACQACGLCQTRTQTVFGVGHPRAQWMIVGEAPGEQEDRRGEPFVGTAGQLLDNMLRAIGLTRGNVGDGGNGGDAGDEDFAQRQVYIANTLKCRPPRNRNPEPEELARCRPYLDRQIALVQPRIILAMGRFAVQSLLGSSEPIGRLRGRVHELNGVPVIVTYHPAYLLRNLVDKARAWEDLCLARSTLQARSGSVAR